MEIASGVLAGKSEELLQAFFRAKREEQSPPQSRGVAEE
jgi:hypothetical protein